MNTEASATQQSALYGIVFWSVIQLVLTSVHHVYGAVVFDTPARFHMPAVAIPLALGIIGAYRHIRQSDSVATQRLWIRIVQFVAFVFPFLMISLFEGAYNHMAKNILFFAGASGEMFGALFPQRFYYEPPSNVLFEVTGVLQAILGGMILMAFVRFRRGGKPSLKLA